MATRWTKDGAVIIARDDVQAAAFAAAGYTEQAEPAATQPQTQHGGKRARRVQAKTNDQMPADYGTEGI